jgi:hypothetical protein
MGYYVTSSNSHINIYHPFSSYYRAQDPVVLRSLLDDNGKERKPGNILEFKSTTGDVTPYGSSHSYILKTLDKKGKSVQHSAAPGSSGLGRKVTGRFTQEITMNAVDKDALRQYSEGYVKQSVPHHANVVVLGVSNLTPGTVVFITSINSEIDGYWVVAEARHHINTDHYMTYLHLITDSTNKDAAIKARGKSFMSPPIPRLNGGTWITSKEFKYVY